MVVLWSPAQSYGHCPPETLRRLHLAVIERETMLIHFRSKSCMSQPSPAWLRFGYAADDTHIRLQVLKCRGRELTRPLITLDRAAVQARLYGHFQATERLDCVITNGVSATALHSPAARVIAHQTNAPKLRSASLTSASTAH